MESFLEFKKLKDAEKKEEIASLMRISRSLPESPEKKVIQHLYRLSISPDLGEGDELMNDIEDSMRTSILAAIGID